MADTRSEASDVDSKSSSAPEEGDYVKFLTTIQDRRLSQRSGSTLSSEMSGEDVPTPTTERPSEADHVRQDSAATITYFHRPTSSRTEPAPQLHADLTVPTLENTRPVSLPPPPPPPPVPCIEALPTLKKAKSTPCLLESTEHSKENPAEKAKCATADPSLSRPTDTSNVQAKTNEKASIRINTPTSATDSKKPGIRAFVREISRSSSFPSDLGLTPPPDVPIWQPTWLRPSPLAGIAALILVICCALASLGILTGSNGKHVEDWAWSPSVFLAISSAIISRSLQFALLQALPIAWWYKAYRGSTVRGLQRHWESGQGICRAIYNADHEPVLALAMIAAVLVVADGPFLQKASSVGTTYENTTVALNFPVAPELPTAFSGRFSERGLSTSTAVDPALEGYTVNSTLSANITGCKGYCRATVHGPGVMIKNCSSQTWPLTPDELLHNRSATWGSGAIGRVAPMPLFNINLRDRLHISPHVEGAPPGPPFIGPEEVVLHIGIANFSDCVGQYVETSCSIVSAILEYDVMIKDHDVINLAKPPSEARVVAAANNTFINATELPVPLTISGLAAFFAGHIFANASMRPSSDTRETAAEIMPDRNSFNNMVDRYTLDSSHCWSSFADPTKSILDDFNNLMFRAGIAAANFSDENGDVTFQLDPGLSLTQNVTGLQTLRVNVFVSDLRWWAGAALLEVLAVFAILPIFWGYWSLGLRVTMSPFEIAKAFEAPLLRSATSGSGSRGIEKAMGDVQVRFGTADQSYDRYGPGKDFEGTATESLIVGEREDVVRPRRGTRFVE